MPVIIPFQFENQAVRVVADANGDPLFVAKDVAESLGYIWNGSSRIQHVPDDWRGVTSVVTPSGTQEMVVLTEQGLYFFLGRSDKPKALPFQRLVAGEIMPSIRKTGRYQVQAPAPTSSPVIQFTKDYLDSAALFGVPLHLAQVEAVKAVQLTHNVDFSSLLQHAPAQSNLSAQDVYLEPTPLGVKLSLGSGIATNLVLADLGLQVKTEGGWQLTPLAEGKAILGQWTKFGKTGTNYRWKVEAIKALLASRLN